jgi:hypothetical protein
MTDSPRKIKLKMIEIQKIPCYIFLIIIIGKVWNKAYGKHFHYKMIGYFDLKFEIFKGLLKVFIFFFLLFTYSFLIILLFISRLRISKLNMESFDFYGF